MATPKGRKHFGLARPVQLGPPRSNPPSYAARALASMVGWAAKLTSAAKSRSHGKLHNNDEPTPRFAPDNDDERRSLREEAARGAGTPGYLTKQPQGRTVTGDQRHHSSDRLDSGSTSKSAGGSSSSSSAGPSSPASPERTGGGGRQMPADEAADSFSPSRGELDEASKPADISDNGQQPTSPGGRPLSPHSGRSSPGRHSPSKPSDHEQGIWQGILNIFRSEKKKSATTGVPSELFGGGPPVSTGLRSSSSCSANSTSSAEPCPSSLSCKHNPRPRARADQRLPFSRSTRAISLHSSEIHRLYPFYRST